MRILWRFWRPAALALAFGLFTAPTTVRAEPPREELVHAYRLLKTADHDYAGHRKVALAEVEAAGRGLGLELGGDLFVGERGWKSDRHLVEARRYLIDARKKLERRDLDRVATRVDRAIREIDAALAVVPSAPVAPIVVAPPVVVPPPVVVAPVVPAPPPGGMEAPRRELVHAYRLLKTADRDYGGHRRIAMAEVEAAGRALGLELGGDVLARERQWKSDQHLVEARRLLRDARQKLEARDRDRVAARVDRAIREIDAALLVR